MKTLLAFGTKCRSAAPANWSAHLAANLDEMEKVVCTLQAPFGEGVIDYCLRREPEELPRQLWTLVLWRLESAGLRPVPLTTEYGGQYCAPPEQQLHRLFQQFVESKQLRAAKGQKIVMAPQSKRKIVDQPEETKGPCV